MPIHPARTAILVDCQVTTQRTTPLEAKVSHVTGLFLLVIAGMCEMTEKDLKDVKNCIFASQKSIQATVRS